MHAREIGTASGAFQITFWEFTNKITLSHVQAVYNSIIWNKFSLLAELIMRKGLIKTMQVYIKLRKNFERDLQNNLV